MHLQHVNLSPNVCAVEVKTVISHQMMSVHTERMVSEKLLQALCDIACTAAYQIGQCLSFLLHKLLLFLCFKL